MPVRVVVIAFGAMLWAFLLVALLAEWMLSTDYMPRAHCVRAEPFVVWGSVLADSLTALSYYTIPLGLVLMYVRTRRVSRHRVLPVWVLLVFALFIGLCGTVHLIDVWMFWSPTYRLSTTVKIMTAIASVATATVFLLEVVPQSVRLAKELERAAEVTRG